MTTQGSSEDCASLKALLADIEPFVIAWAAHYAHNQGMNGWHETHLEWVNKIRSATGRELVKMEDVRA